VRTIERATDRPLLSLEEVAAARRPATFSCYGDHLMYREGTIYALPRRPEPSDLAEPAAPADAYVITHTVGIEFGWRHLEGCLCSLCDDTGEGQVA
jgi:hypothetical protein